MMMEPVIRFDKAVMRRHLSPMQDKMGQCMRDQKALIDSRSRLVNEDRGETAIDHQHDRNVGSGKRGAPHHQTMRVAESDHGNGGERTGCVKQILSH